MTRKILRVGVFLEDRLIDAAIVELETTSRLEEAEIDWPNASLKVWEEYKEE